MPRRLLSNWLNGFLEYTERGESPYLYKKWTGIWILCAALENRVFVQWDKLIYPNLYVFLTGPTSARKGTAIGPAATLLNKLNMNLAPQSTTWQALLDVFKEGQKPIEGMPEIYPYATIHPCHVIASEFAAFAKRNNDEMMDFLTDIYDYQTQHYKHYTRTCGKFDLEGAHLHMLAAIQPALIPHVFPQHMIGLGITARIIFVYGKDKSHLEPLPAPTDSENALFEDLQHDLETISFLQGQFTVTDKFKELLTAWYIDFNKTRPFYLGDSKFDGYLNRRVTTLLKISMAFQVAQSDELVLDENVFHLSTMALEEVEREMRFVYSSYGKLEIAELINPIIDLILGTEGWIAYSDIAGRFYRDARTEDITHILNGLVSEGVIERRPNKNITEYRALEDI